MAKKEDNIKEIAKEYNIKKNDLLRERKKSLESKM